MNVVNRAIGAAKNFFSTKAVQVFLVRTLVSLVAVFGVWSFYNWATTVGDQTKDKRKIAQVESASTLQASLDQHKLALINLFYVDGSQPDSDISMATVWNSIDSNRADLEKAINGYSSNDQKVAGERQKVLALIEQEKKLFEAYKNEYKSVDRIMQYVIGIDIDLSDVSKNNDNVSKISAATTGLDKYLQLGLLSAETKGEISKVTACLSNMKQNLSESKQEEASKVLVLCEKQYRTLRKNTLIDINNTSNSKDLDQLVTKLGEVSLQ